MEKLKELSPHLSFKNKGVMNRSKAFKLIKEPKPCPSKGFLPLLCFSKHYPSHLLNHNVYNLKKSPKVNSPWSSQLQVAVRLILWVCHAGQRENHKKKVKSLDEN